MRRDNRPGGGGIRGVVAGITRFAGASGIGLTLDLAVAGGALFIAGASLRLATILGLIAGALVNYVLHELWTFRDGARQLSVRRATLFALAVAPVFAARLASVWLLERLLPAGPAWQLPILIIAVGVSFCVSYLISRHAIFRRRTGAESR